MNVIKLQYWKDGEVDRIVVFTGTLEECEDYVDANFVQIRQPLEAKPCTLHLEEPA